MLLLASKHDKDSRLGFTDTEIKAALNTNLDNLNLLGRTSLMTYKARNCLLKLRIAFDVLCKPAEACARTHHVCC